MRAWRQAATHWRAVLGWTALVVYLSWNVYWFAHGRLAPSILKAATGIPAPTTGGMRAMEALAAGDWRTSLRANPFAVPIGGLFIASLAVLAVQLLRGRRPKLANGWLVAWLGLLAVAWIAKLLGDRQYW
ncbi:MAG: DUF2752 domain-containing protein [Gemmataceae bacterium]